MQRAGKGADAQSMIALHILKGRIVAATKYCGDRRGAMQHLNRNALATVVYGLVPPQLMRPVECRKEATLTRAPAAAAAAAHAC